MQRRLKNEAWSVPTHKAEEGDEGKGRVERRVEQEGGRGGQPHAERPEVAVSNTGVTKRVAAARSKPSSATPVLAHALTPAWGLTRH